MFHTKELNNQMNSLHKKASRLSYQYRNLSFDELLKLDKSVSVHYRNLEYLSTEIHEAQMGLSLSIRNDILTLNQNTFYNLRFGVKVTDRNTRKAKFGFEIISTIGAVLWEDLSNSIQNSDSLNDFKHKIKQWTPDKCPCSIFRNFIKKLGYTGKPHLCAPSQILRSFLNFSLRYFILKYL